MSARPARHGWVDVPFDDGDRDYIWWVGGQRDSLDTRPDGNRWASCRQWGNFRTHRHREAFGFAGELAVSRVVRWGDTMGATARPIEKGGDGGITDLEWGGPTVAVKASKDLSLKFGWPPDDFKAEYAVHVVPVWSGEVSISNMPHAVVTGWIARPWFMCMRQRRNFGYGDRSVVGSRDLLSIEYPLMTPPRTLGRSVLRYYALLEKKGWTR